MDFKLPDKRIDILCLSEIWLYGNIKLFGWVEKSSMVEEVPCRIFFSEDIQHGITKET